jgi:hypothetical protein
VRPAENLSVGEQSRGGGRDVSATLELDQIAPVPQCRLDFLVRAFWRAILASTDEWPAR